MTSVYTALYTLALLTQMFAISVHLPARMIGAVKQARLELYEPQVDGYRSQRYLNRNRFVAVLGLVPVLVAWLSDFEKSLTLILLTTGLYFFLQVGTLFFDRDVRSLFSVGRRASSHEVPGVPPMTARTGSRVVPLRFSRVLVVGAAVAYVVYVAASVINENEAAATLWAKIQIVTLANVFFVFIVIANLVSMQRGSTEESHVRRLEVGRSINILASISIGLSAYFFGKDVLLDLGLSALRPLMMSVFLQALALLTVHAQLETSFSTQRGDPGTPRTTLA